MIPAVSHPASLSGPFVDFYCVRLAVLAVLTFLLLSSAAMAQEDETANNARKTGTISGRVLNEIGQPIPHASIFVTAQRSLPQPRTTTTDEGGNFQVADLDALVYFVNATAPSYINPPREPDSSPQYYRIGDSVTINMIKGGVITGTVTAAAGEPLVQIGVRAQMIRDGEGKVPTSARYPAERRTDDRGVYRIYGLPPGTYLVSAGGRGSYSLSGTVHDTDAPTFSPSSTRDTAAEVVVRAGEEATGIDIRYRNEPGRAISGTVVSPGAETATNITLTQIIDGRSHISSYSYRPNSKGFAFYGVTDGEYELVAQSNFSGNEGAVSEPRRVTIKGADVTGVELVVKALASISGQVVLEDSNAPECANKKRPLLSETLVVARRSQKQAQPQVLPNFSSTQAAVDVAGDFRLRNLAPGQFSLHARFFAKYWYLSSIRRESAVQSLRNSPASAQNDVARTGFPLKFGEGISGVKVTLALGAASLQGVVTSGDGARIPAGLFLHLVPAEKESAEDALRFFTAPVNGDGTFAVGNLAPGRYWVLTRVAAETEPKSDEKLRAPDEATLRSQLRLAAEAAKTHVEFRPCQNVIDYQLPLKFIVQ